MRKQTMCFPNRSDTNRSVQSQKMARSLKNFGFRKGNCTILVAKTKALISFAITAMLTYALVFTYAKCLISHNMALL